MILSVIGADMTWPSLTLFVSKSVPREDQALGGALINACGQIDQATINSNRRGNHFFSIMGVDRQIKPVSMHSVFNTTLIPA